ncbi:MAG: type II toxin-antitoxin system Phd/YefM family antitoxin [Deltaproteobacteria bacterium]|nr:type II toxin-antitoxin system Phd/YefM family antitoxin [Deltaproteobacteria bacterium]
MHAIKLSRDFRPVSDLKTHGGEIVRGVVASGQPVVISRRGRAAVVMLAVRDYEAMAAATERVALLDALAEAERDVAAGRVSSQEEVEAMVARWEQGGE